MNDSLQLQLMAEHFPLKPSIIYTEDGNISSSLFLFRNFFFKFVSLAWIVICIFRNSLDSHILQYLLVIVLATAVRIVQYSRRDKVAAVIKNRYSLRVGGGGGGAGGVWDMFRQNTYTHINVFKNKKKEYTEARIFEFSSSRHGGILY